MGDKASFGNKAHTLTGNNCIQMSPMKSYSLLSLLLVLLWHISVMRSEKCCLLWFIVVYLMYFLGSWNVVGINGHIFNYTRWFHQHKLSPISYDIHVSVDIYNFRFSLTLLWTITVTTSLELLLHFICFIKHLKSECFTKFPITCCMCTCHLMPFQSMPYEYISL